MARLVWLEGYGKSDLNEGRHFRYRRATGLPRVRSNGGLLAPCILALRILALRSEDLEHLGPESRRGLP